MHVGFGDVVLGQGDCEFLGAVVAVVEEYHHVALLDAAVHGLVDNGLDEFVGHALGVRLLHSLHHVVGLLARAVHQHVVSLLDALPALVAVHGVVAAANCCDHACALLAVVLNFGQEACAALGVGVTAVHERMQIHFAQTVGLGRVAQGVEVLQRRVYAAGRRQAHEVDGHIVLLGIAERADYLGILLERAVLDGAVDLHQVLIHHAAAADVEVTHLRVAHLAVGQTYVLATGLELGMRILLHQPVHVRCRGVVNGVILLVIAQSISIQDNQH